MPLLSLYILTALPPHRMLLSIYRTVSSPRPLDASYPSLTDRPPSAAENIGRLFRTRFKGSQFIVVSLKDGLFSNANGSSSLYASPWTRLTLLCLDSALPRTLPRWYQYRRADSAAKRVLTLR